MVNALTGRKTLAKVSQTPGRTQQLNFFNLGGVLRLVDLPGYGYAEAGKKAIRQWTGLTNAFLKGRPNLRRVLVLIDARHGIKETDLAAMTMLDEAAVNYQIALTKADKCKPSELATVTAATTDKLRRRVAAHPVVLATSAESGAGIPELRAELAGLAEYR